MYLSETGIQHPRGDIIDTDEVLDGAAALSQAPWSAKDMSVGKSPSPKYSKERGGHTKRLATLGLISGAISISLFLQFACILPTRLAVLQLPELATRIGFLVLAIDFCLVPAFGTAAVVMSAIALRRLGLGEVTQSTRHAQTGMILGVLTVPAYISTVILFSLVIFFVQVEMV